MHATTDVSRKGIVGMNIVLSRLTAKNFKGLRDFTADFSSLTEVYGTNASGKTTIFDAFCWLLFDKDSHNKKDFDIKPLDGNNKVIHGLSPEVEAVLIVNGKSLTLRKVFSEKWTKKRGSATAEFTGHTTDYFIDGVPVKQKEYKDRIDALIDEGIFKLITSPAYFNEQLDWKARRTTLLEIAGDVTDEEVISTNESLARLPFILNGRSIEDHRKVIAARRAEINKELEKLPIRIDEAQRSKPDTDGLNEVELKAQVEELKLGVQAKESELSRLQTGGEVAVQETRIREIEGELLQIKNQAQQAGFNAVAQQRAMVSEISNEVSRLTNTIARTLNTIGSNQLAIEDRKTDAQRLRQQWGEVNAQEFVDHHQQDSCPACGQSLPQEQVQAAHDKALAEFNRQKSERLERITAQGKSAMVEVQRLTDENTKLETELEAERAQLADAQSRLTSAQAELTRLQSNIQDISDDPAYIAKQHELDAVKSKLSQLRSSVQADVERVRLELIDARDELRRTETKLAAFSQIRTLDARIEELKQQERTLAGEYERLEEELYLTEEFIRTKVNLLETKINSKFKMARFKLFEQQVNGGLAETCETLYNGVPYGGGLNNAAKINVGLDIINTLSEHYGISAPIFVDNAESVVQLEGTRSQVIALYVNAKDKTLRFETGEVIAKEAV